MNLDNLFNNVDTGNSGVSNWGFNLGSYTGDAYASLGQAAFQSMGFDPGSAAMFGSEIGLTAQAPGNVNFPGTGSGSSTPNQSGAATVQQRITCMNSQNLLYATPADTAACSKGSGVVVDAATKAAQAANGVLGNWWANLTFSGVVTAVLGIGLVVGGLYLFGSGQLSSALTNVK